MEQKKQEKRYALTEEQRAAFLKAEAEHKKQMATDPEYRAMWEERIRKLEKHSSLIGESME